MRYEWWPSTRGSTPHSGRQWRRSLRRSVVPQKHCVSGSGKQSVIWANVGAGRDDQQRLKELERENRELKRANEILRKASAFFAQAELDRRPR